MINKWKKYKLEENDSNGRRDRQALCRLDTLTDVHGTPCRVWLQSIAVPFENSVTRVFCVSLRTPRRGGKFEQDRVLCAGH